MRTSPIAFLVLLAACGPTAFKPFCEQSAEASCRQLFRCKPDDAKRLYADVGACATDLKTRARCEAFEGQKCTLDGSKTARCLSDLESAACTTTAGALPESCRSISCTDAAVKCSGTSSDSAGGACSYTLTGCSDSNTYGVSCTGASCACQKNGSATRAFSGTCAATSSERLAQLKAECSVEVQ